MKLKVIKLNQFQLNVLLDDRQKEIYKSIIPTNVFCIKCSDICAQGIIIEDISLNELNDILVKGTCQKCGSKVARVIEFGENKSFYDKAIKFRKSISS